MVVIMASVPTAARKLIICHGRSYTFTNLLHTCIKTAFLNTDVSLPPSTPKIPDPGKQIFIHSNCEATTYSEAATHLRANSNKPIEHTIS
jgi:hypothetical protein